MRLNGTKVWSHATLGLVDHRPAVANGIVYIGSRSNWDNVYALNATNGTKVWSHSIGNFADLSCCRQRNRLLRQRRQQRLRPLNATTGTRVWSYATGDAVWAAPAVADGIIYVGSYDSNVYALTATTGAKVWNYITGSIVSSSLSSPTESSMWGAVEGCNLRP